MVFEAAQEVLAEPAPFGACLLQHLGDGRVGGPHAPGTGHRANRREARPDRSIDLDIPHVRAVENGEWFYPKGPERGVRSERAFLAASHPRMASRLAVPHG